MKRSTSLLLLALAACGFPQGYKPEFFKDLRWVSIGPARGGRSIACTGVKCRPDEFYFGASGGGVWKSTDAGKNWKCVSDGFLKSSSVGAIAVSESKPDVIYVGMGEREIRGNLAEGDGLYKSTDAGATWTKLGLEDTRVVSRIAVDPTNPDIVYVAAFGHVFGQNDERGIYKSTNGGKTWRKTLFESNAAGAVDIQIDPLSPSTLYASTWEAFRTPYLLSSGGPGSKLWKSTDGGEHWTDISKNPGLPTGILGKITTSPSRAKAGRVYAFVESSESGLYRSEDSGATWSKLTSDHKFTQRAWYFGHVYADPKDAEKAFCLNVGAFQSKDGGKTWTGLGTPHSDNHDLWINPDDNQRMIESNDGGAAVSTDGGKTWSKMAYSTAQFYHVHLDNAFPYRVYGCQQDNSSVRVSPSEPNFPEQRNWRPSAGGESGYMATPPNDPNTLFGGNYGGYLERLDQEHNLSYNASPWPLDPTGHGADEAVYRFQWTYPIVFSPFKPYSLYVGSQYVMKSDDLGRSWKKISPDLTRNEKEKQKPSGGPLTKDNTGVEVYGTVFTIAESPAQQGVIWAGSDDGLVNVTSDGGDHWTNVTPAGLPRNARISMIEASRFNPDVAYLAANNYQNDDQAVYLYRTRDRGRSWRPINSGIPYGAFARVCRESLHRAGLLFAGTEQGAYVSFDDGDSWQSLQNNLPLTPVHDLALKDDDLVAATHGRSFWVLHNVRRLEELTGAPITKPTIFAPTDPYRFDDSSVSFEYFLPAKAKEVKLTILDHKGRVFAAQRGDEEVGMHHKSMAFGRAAWHSFGGMVFWTGGPSSVPAPPGDYVIRMEIDGAKIEQGFTLKKDPRNPASLADLREQFDLAVQVARSIDSANDSVARIRETRNQIDDRIKKAPDLAAMGEEVKAMLTHVEEALYQTKATAGEDLLNFPNRLNDQLVGLFGAIVGNQAKPSPGMRQVYAILQPQLDAQLIELKHVEGAPLARLNAALKAKHLDEVVPKTPPAQNRSLSLPERKREEEREAEDEG